MDQPKKITDVLYENKTETQSESMTERNARIRREEEERRVNELLGSKDLSAETEHKTKKREKVKTTNGRKIAEPEEKIQVNLYLTVTAKEKLEDLQYRMRRETDHLKRNQINYSLITETAINKAFDEYEKNGASGEFYRTIEKQI